MCDKKICPVCGSELEKIPRVINHIHISSATDKRPEEKNGVELRFCPNKNCRYILW